MSLIGDVLLSARELFTDLPLGVLAAPGIGAASDLATPAVVSSPGSTLPVSATYAVVICYVTPWNGVTIASAETAGLNIGANQGIKIAAGSLGIPPGVGIIRVFFGPKGAGLENQSIDISPSALPFIISIPGNIDQSPARSSAYLPDTDGSYLSAGALYRWLNDGLFVASTLNNGGIPDVSGVGTVVSVPDYLINGQWKKFDSAWYDGYPVSLGYKNQIFKRNITTGITGTAVLNSITNQIIVELYPQPARTSGQTTLSAPLTSGATAASVAASNFVIGYGLALIGTEIVQFSSNAAGSMTGLIRGIGGTLAQSWPSGTAVTELNFYFSGLRVPTPYTRGSAGSTFTLAAGWEEAMVTYLLHRYKKAEQDIQEAKSLYEDFKNLMKGLSANKIVMGPRQIQVGGNEGPSTVPGLGSPFGSVILP